MKTWSESPIGAAAGREVPAPGVTVSLLAPYEPEVSMSSPTLEVQSLAGARSFRLLWLLCFAWPLIASCGLVDGTTVDAADDVDAADPPPVDTSPDAEVAPPPPDGEPMGEFETVVAQYGVIRTVAGLGRIREKGENGWEARFEGGPAVEAELSRPHMTMADDAGNLYIADKDAQTIRLVRPDGTIHTIAGREEIGDDGDAPGPAVEKHLYEPNGIWVRGDGTYYVLDMGNKKIRKVSGGEMTTMFEDPMGLGNGRGLWVSDDETLVYYAATTDLRAWTGGEGIRTIASDFVQLGNLIVDDDDSIVVADRGGHTVWRVTPEGIKTRLAGNGTTTGGGDGNPALETGLDNVRGVWRHPAGGYLLATHAGGQIWYLDTSGIIHLFVDGDEEHSHTGDGQHFRTPGKKISEPRAVTMDATGRIILTESDFGYVRLIELRDQP